MRGCSVSRGWSSGGFAPSLTTVYSFISSEGNGVLQIPMAFHSVAPRFAASDFVRMTFTPPDYTNGILTVFGSTLIAEYVGTTIRSRILGRDLSWHGSQHSVALACRQSGDASVGLLRPAIWGRYRGTMANRWVAVCSSRLKQMPPRPREAGFRLIHQYAFMYSCAASRCPAQTIRCASVAA